jgi:hypothetical protein
LGATSFAMLDGPVTQNCPANVASDDTNRGFVIAAALEVILHCSTLTE